MDSLKGFVLAAGDTQAGREFAATMADVVGTLEQRISDLEGGSAVNKDNIDSLDQRLVDLAHTVGEIGGSAVAKKAGK